MSKTGVRTFEAAAFLRRNGADVTRVRKMFREDALEYKAKADAVPLDLLPKLEGNKFYFHEVVGFRVIDEEKGDIGTLQQVIDYPAQPLFQIMKNGVEILVPVIDQVIRRVDREQKTLYIAAPNGLIDLYLGDMNK